LIRILHIGDIVGKPGRVAVRDALPGLIQREKLDFVIANAENAAGGSGMTPEIYRELMQAGVDCVTLGDHIYRRREIMPLLGAERNIVKPANYPSDAPGLNHCVVDSKSGVAIAVISLMGRVFMKPVDCPWAAVDRVLKLIPSTVKVICVDFHAEATSDKQLMGRYLDGRVTSVLGTHTHVPTADEQVFPGGTAFQCDLGMTGPYESILGRRIDRVLLAARTFVPSAFDVATEDVRLSASIVDADQLTGRASSIRRICLKEDDVLDIKCTTT
jgi:metallophosphoesterase (TIGR00282 family)